MTATRRWAIGTAIACVVILAAGWFLLVKPQNAKVTTLHEDAATQLSQNALLQTQIRALQAEQSQLPQQQKLLEKFATSIPDSAAEPSIIRQLTSTAKGAGVDISTITPGSAVQVSAAAAAATQSLGAPTATGGPLYSLPLSLTVSGSYANVESFFAGLERLPRAFLVNTFSLSRAATTTDGGANMLAATIATSVFFSPAVPGAAPITPTGVGATPAPASTDAGTTPASTSTDATNPAASAASPAAHAAGASDGSDGGELAVN